MSNVVIILNIDRFFSVLMYESGLFLLLVGFVVGVFLVSVLFVISDFMFGFCWLVVVVK